MGFWLLEKSNKKYISRLLLERPCFDFFQFTISGLTEQNERFHEIKDTDMQEVTNTLLGWHVP